MHKLLIILSLCLTFQANAASKVTDFVTDYVIPCGVGMGVAMALSSDQGPAIGTAVCAGVSAATFFNKKPVENSELQKAVDFSVEVKSKELDSKMTDQLVKFDENQSQKMDEFRKITREVLAERLKMMEDDLRADLEKKISEGEILPTLEKKINQTIKEEVVLEGRLRNKEMINQIVDEVIRRVVGKPIVVPESQGE